MELNFWRNVIHSGIPFEQKRQVPHATIPVLCVLDKHM